MSGIAKILTTISRFIIGVLFIISGLIKANDALGFSYKLEEYFDVFHQILTMNGWDGLASVMLFFSEMALPMAMFICVIEIVLGVAALIGSKMKLVSWSLLLMILFFTWLTFYSASCDPSGSVSCVTDCGCFGDALKLTPWGSFKKDLFLLAWIVIIFWNRKHIEPLFPAKNSTMIVVMSTIFSTLFTIYTYRHLPIKDWRAYKEGTKMMEAMTPVPGEFKNTYVLIEKATGEKKEFDAFPDNWNETYDWGEMKQEVIVPEIEPKIKDFGIMTEDGYNYTEEYLNDSTDVFFLICKDLSHLGSYTSDENGVVTAFKADQSTTEDFKLINEFAKSSEAVGVKFIVLTASYGGMIDEFRNALQTPYPFYQCDEKELKTFIRSNPGLVLIKKGVITKKWHINDFPSFDEVAENYELKK